MRRWAIAVLLLGGCDRVLGLQTVGSANPDAPVAPDALACSSSIAPGAFTAPLLLFTGTSPSVTGDQRVMYLAGGGAVSYATHDTTWSIPAPVDTLDDPASYDDRPRVSYDGTHMFLTRHPSGTSNAVDQPYEATLVDAATQLWSPVTAVAYPPSLAGGDVSFGTASADGRLVPVSHGQISHYHLTELALVGGAWTLTVATAALYTPGDDVSDTGPQLSPDGCWMVFARIDHSVSSLHVLMLAKRGLDGNFGPPIPLFETASGNNEQQPSISPDGNTLYYFIGTDVYVSTRTS